MTSLLVKRNLSISQFKLEKDIALLRFQVLQWNVEKILNVWKIMHLKEYDFSSNPA